MVLSNFIVLMRTELARIIVDIPNGMIKDSKLEEITRM